MEHSGIDVYKKESQICTLGEDGQVVVERRVRTEGERFASADRLGCSLRPCGPLAGGGRSAASSR